MRQQQFVKNVCLRGCVSEWLLAKVKFYVQHIFEKFFVVVLTGIFNYRTGGLQNKLYFKMH